MNKYRPLLALILFAGCRSILLAEQNEPSLEPKLEEVTLTLGGRSLKPVSSREIWSYGRHVGALEIVIGPESATATDIATGVTKWEAPFKAEGPMRWLADDGLTIYLVPEKPLTDTARVLRLEASTGRWLDPLMLSAEDLKEKTVDTVGAAILENGSLFALILNLVRGQGPGDNGTLVSYRVSRIGAGRTTPDWSRRFLSAGTRGKPGAYLMAARRPDYAVDSPSPLVLVGDDLVVCAGPKEDLVSLKQADGVDVWRLPRIWEYRRGFIGPSVWTHYLGRYGMESYDLELAEKEIGKAEGTSKEYHKAIKEQVRQARARVEAEDGFIVAGPVAVPATRPGMTSLFVVAGRSDGSAWAGYLAEAVLYELTGSGVPIAIAPLPRMVNPGQHFADTGAILWGCPRGALLRVRPSPHRRDFGGMLGVADMLCQIDWYRNPEIVGPAAWLVADPAGDPIAWTPSHAFRPLGGGYVEKTGDTVYHFPIAKIDVVTGLSETLILNVPFQGEVPKPSTNYSGTPDNVHAHGPYLLGVTWLDVLGDTLEVVIGRPNKASSIRFRLAELGTK